MGDGKKGKRQQQRSEWWRENISFNALIARQHRDLAQFYDTRSDFHQDAVDLRNREREDTALRLTDAREAKKRLDDQKATMLQIKSRVQRVAEGLEAPGDLGAIMERLEDQLYGFTCTMKKDYDILAAKEKDLNREVDDLRGMVKGWESHLKVDLPPNGYKRCKEGHSSGDPGGDVSVRNGAATDKDHGGDSDGNENTSRGDEGRDGTRQAVSSGEGGGVGQTRSGAVYRDAVERINALIAREGGATGGWPQHEHDCFLRLWTQANRASVSGTRPLPSSSADKTAVASLVQRAATLLPTREPEHLKAHLSWHERYLGYLEEKKSLAREWRQLRQPATLKEEIAGGVQANGYCTEVAGEKVRQAARAAAHERERKRIMVEEWRAAKEAQEKKQLEEKRRHEAKDGANANEIKRRQRRVQAQVAAYRMEREREENRRREIERMIAREERRHSQTDIEARVRQDVEKARRRREEASAKDENRRVEEHRRKTAVSGRWAAVTTDGTRLLSATKASKERVLEPEDLDDIEDARASRPAHRSTVPISGRDLRFVGRAVPSWRRGLV